MRVVFMGTPAFAVPSLVALAEAHDVSLVFTRPDAVSGRGKALRPSPVKEAAAGLGLEVRTPATLRDVAEHDAIRRAGPDIGVVAAFGLILPPDVLSIPELGFVNVHASLLPRWRGAAPIQRAILAGDEETGVSIMRMEAGLDTGPFCDAVSTPIADKTAAELTAELADLGAEALMRALRCIEGCSCAWTYQDEAQVTYAEKLSKDDVLLSPDLSAADNVRRVRASSRQAPARLVVGDRALTALGATVARTRDGAALASGHAVVREEAFVLGTTDGAFVLSRLKPEGRGEMDADAWLRGANLPDESAWTTAP